MKSCAGLGGLAFRTGARFLPSIKRSLPLSPPVSVCALRWHLDSATVGRVNVCPSLFETNSMQATTACTRARGRKHSPVHPAFLPASGEPVASRAARSLAALLRILCHFCASTPAEQPASGCLTCLSVHCRATFVLHRQAGTAGTNHCPCLQITRANKAPAGTRTSSPENSPRWCLDRPCELQAWAVVRAGRTRLPMKQQRFLRCSA